MVVVLKEERLTLRLSVIHANGQAKGLQPEPLAVVLGRKR